MGDRTEQENNYTSTLSSFFLLLNLFFLALRLFYENYIFLKCYVTFLNANVFISF